MAIPDEAGEYGGYIQYIHTYIHTVVTSMYGRLPAFFLSVASARIVPTVVAF